MAFWSRIGQSKVRQLSYQSKTIPNAALINPTASHSKACMSEIPRLIPHDRPTDFGNKVRFFAAPIQKIEQSTSGPRMDEKITAKFVRLVLDEEHFIVSRCETLERVRKLDLDLVEVEAKADPLVCKIMDFQKEKYSNLDSKFTRLHKRAKQRIQDFQKEKDDLEEHALHYQPSQTCSALPAFTSLEEEQCRCRWRLHPGAEVLHLHSYLQSRDLDR
ncbi:hypothetical protein ACFX2I_043118 [Malus domestica]